MNTDYAAFYYPWVYVSDLRTGAKKKIPSSGHVLGLYARSDIARGVSKAPANDTLTGVLDLEYYVDTNTQEVLNPRSVNAVRRFPGRGIQVWGARTLTDNSLWRYISVRRLFIFLERSIYVSTQWVVFEPNDDRLWERVKDTIRLFLRTQWRNGALFGATEDEAFVIACDRSTMTQDDILNGRLICEIGIAPVRPAEFVVFRIYQTRRKPRPEREQRRPTMARNDPLRNMRFRVEIDQITQGYFSEVAIGETTTEAIDYREGIDPTHVRKLPDLTKYGNITLKWGVTDSVELYEWHKKVVGGGIKDARKNVKIIVIDESGADKASFLVSEAWPTKYDPSDLNGKGNEVFIELLELVNEGIGRTR